MKKRYYNVVMLSKFLNKIIRFSIGIIILSFFASTSYSDKADTWFSIYFTRNYTKHNNTGPVKALAALIDNTNESFSGSFYELTSRKIIRSLIKAKKRGVQVRLVIEDTNYHKPEIYSLQKANIPIVTDNRDGLMHNKFAIIDKKIVWTGSYNATDNGSKNNNNAIVIKSEFCADIYLI